MFKKVLSTIISLMLIIGTLSVLSVPIKAAETDLPTVSAEVDLTDNSVDVELDGVGTSISLHVWMSDSPMGSVPSNYYARNSYYMCYELIDTNGTRLNNIGDYNYTVTETIYGVNGNQECSYQYSNSDYDWIELTAYEAGQYRGIVSVTGDLTISVDVDYKLQYKAAASANPTRISLTLGGSNSTTLRITPSGNYPGTVAGSWEHDSSIANVSFRGWDDDTAILDVSGLKVGKTNLVYSIDEAYTEDRKSVAKVTIPITVNSKDDSIIQPASISLNKSSLTLGVNESYSLNAAIAPLNATNKSVSWKSSAPGVATISNGRVSAKGVGTTIITATTSNGKTAKCSVTVKNAPSSISLNKKALTLAIGEKFDLNSSLPAGSAAHSIVYSSSNTSVCAVEPSGGLATAKSPGTATITATTYNGKKATCSVSVVKKNSYLYDSPLISSLTSIAKGVKITWKSVGAAKYRVYYYGSKGWTRMGETTGTSFVDEDVRVGKTYRYTVRCINSEGTKFTSDCNSTGWKYTYQPKLDTPKISGCETISNGVKINWKAVANAYKYRVYYKNRNGNWVKMGETTGTSFVDTDVKGGATYTYTVRCLAAKEGDFASSHESGKSHTYVEAPSITKLTSLSNGVNITWTPKAGASRYRVYYKNRNGNWIKMSETTATSYLDTDVKNGGNYTYTVRCVNSNGDFTSWFHTSGWKCTYYANNWSSLYRDFILNKRYLDLKTEFAPKSGSYDYNRNQQNSISFRLIDFDKDGTPELVADSGYSYGGYLYYVYKVKNNKVICWQRFASFGEFYYNPNYKGIFANVGHQGVHRVEYHYVSNNKMATKEVVRFIAKDATDFSKGFTNQYGDKDLYNAYVDCTSYVSGSVFRNPKYPIPYYTYSQISSMGWNSFLSKYGY